MRRTERRRINRIHGALLLFVTLLPACGVAGLVPFFEATRSASDASTNLNVGTRKFPRPASVGLALAPETQAWMVHAPPLAEVPRFLLPAEKRPAASVAEAALAITRWQASLRRHDLSALDRMWPADLDAEATSALKLAIERGNDRYTLHQLAVQDLGSDEARERFYGQLQAKAERLRAARGGAAFTIVNTDVDDTVFANLWDRGRYERGQIYPGVLQLLASQGEFVVVLTARPPLLAESTRRRFLQAFGLIGVDPARVNLSIATGALGDILDTLEMGLAKAETLVLQRRLFPEAVSIFNGDSGQGDWIAALILRDLEPAGLPYATIHDVRPWSEHHRNLLRAALVSSPRFERIYRHALGLAPGNLRPADEDRLDRALRKIRGDIDLALAGPMGRLDGVFLKTRGIFLFRNHADLALDLADAGFISQDSANRIVSAAAPALRFLGENPFGYDRDDAPRLATRLAARVKSLGERPVAEGAVPGR